MSWAAHVKKESLDGAAHNPADTCWPTDNKWYLPAPQLHCKFISFSNYVEAPKNCNYVDKPVGPNVSIALGGSIFFNGALCLRMAIDLLGPDCPLLHIEPSPDFSRLFNMFTMVDSSAAANAQRRRTRTNRSRGRHATVMVDVVPNFLRNYWTSPVAKWHYPTTVPPGFDSTWYRENISKFFASAVIDMWVPIVIYAHHVQHLPKLRPSFSMFFAHSTLCGHFENSISFWLCIIWRCAMHELISMMLTGW